MLWGTFLPGALAIATAYPFAGIQAFWFLSIPVTGLVMRAVFGNVGQRVEQLHQVNHGKAGEIAQGLIVIGKVQSPGVIIKNETELELIPIVCKPRLIPLHQLSVFKEGRMLPGKFVWGKRAFIFNPIDGTRLAFAVAEDIGARWSPTFNTTPGKKKPLPQQPSPDSATQQSSHGQQ